MFDLEQFTADCRAALKADSSHKLVREVAARAVADPAGILKALGEPKRPEIQKLYHAPDLTIINVIWRRVGDGSGRIEAAGARALSVGDAEPLGHNIIHSVTNPIPRLTGAIHIYGGDFFGAHRSEWDAETLTEGPMDGKKAVRRFEEANEMYERFYRPQVSARVL